MNEIEDFERRCVKAWGKTERDINQLLDMKTQRIESLIKSPFCDLSSDIKIRIAEKIIKESIRGGAIADSGDGIWYIRNFGKEIEWERGIFEWKRLRPIQAAILLFGYSFIPNNTSPEFKKRDDIGHIFAGGAPMATVYLVSQLEWILRKKCRYLDDEGKVIRQIPNQLAKKIGFKNPKQINQINKTFLIYLYRNNTSIGKKLKNLEKKLSISKRLIYRHLAAHGQFPDISLYVFSSNSNHLIFPSFIPLRKSVFYRKLLYYDRNILSRGEWTKTRSSGNYKRGLLNLTVRMSCFGHVYGNSKPNWPPMKMRILHRV